MKIGFFGGSFNPPTKAHIELARVAIKKCSLDKIIFVPMGDYYEKSELAKAKYRLKMLEIACRGYKEFEISDIEVKENRKLDAIDAFRLIDKTFSNNEKYFIMGADNFIKIDKWKGRNELFTKYNYIVIEREDINLKEYIKKYKINSVNVIKNNEYKYCSSTKLRRSLEKGDDDIYDIIEKNVLEYIIKNNIY